MKSVEKASDFWSTRLILVYGDQILPSVATNFDGMYKLAWMYVSQLEYDAQIYKVLYESDKPAEK
jgi:hypothetical protein